MKTTADPLDELAGRLDDLSKLAAPLMNEAAVTADGCRAEVVTELLDAYHVEQTGHAPQVIPHRWPNRAEWSTPDERAQAARLLLIDALVQYRRALLDELETGEADTAAAGEMGASW